MSPTNRPGESTATAADGPVPASPIPSPVQLRLFPAPQPLVDRLGAEFFRKLPRTPGVYRMFDNQGRLLYVGKAKDLRARLNSYRRTHGQSRKTVRLIHEARRVEWEACASDVEARLLENHLIRTLRPRFNRAGTWPASARYIQFQHEGSTLGLAVVDRLQGLCFGAFRGGVGEALLALARLVWLATHREGRPLDWPHRLVAAERLRTVELPSDAWLGIDEDLREFLAGGNDRLLGRLVDSIPTPDTGFEQSLVAQQFEVLLDFFRRGPVRNTELRRTFAVERPTLEPEEHDDLLVRWSEFAVERIPGLTTTEADG
ncbi:MAG: GIY-YIG nuclease family protein [Verrucomicrobiales bacterium]|nr:GIY-YIG nuclease family protein [Verrucomicrobiales bacterium]